MLTVTENAKAVIRQLTDQPEAPEGAGLRISTDPTAGALTLSLTPGPNEGDQVMNVPDARVFLEPEAAEILDRKVLDAAIDPDGGVEFAVSDQAV